MKNRFIRVLFTEAEPGPCRECTVVHAYTGAGTVEVPHGTRCSALAKHYTAKEATVNAKRVAEFYEVGPYQGSMACSDVSCRIEICDVESDDTISFIED